MPHDGGVLGIHTKNSRDEGKGEHDRRDDGQIFGDLVLLSTEE